MAEMTYTYEWYRGLLERLRDLGHTFHGFESGAPESGVLLRHDIDYSPKAARQMAEIESELGVTGTYFALVTSPFYNPSEPTTRDHLADIADLGHRVGLHFDPHAYFKMEATTNSLQQRIREDRDILENRVDELTHTIAFHNPPDWVLGRCFDGLTHTYEPQFFEDIAYRADSLGRWHEDPPFSDSVPGKVQILVHPALWGDNLADPEHRIRDAQAEMVTRADEAMRDYSRLSWSPASLCR